MFDGGATKSVDCTFGPHKLQKAAVGAYQFGIRSQPNTQLATEGCSERFCWTCSTPRCTGRGSHSAGSNPWPVVCPHFSFLERCSQCSLSVVEQLGQTSRQALEVHHPPWSLKFCRYMPLYGSQEKQSSRRGAIQSTAWRGVRGVVLCHKECDCYFAEGHQLTSVVAGRMAGHCLSTGTSKPCAVRDAESPHPAGCIVHADSDATGEPYGHLCLIWNVPTAVSFALETVGYVHVIMLGQEQITKRASQAWSRCYIILKQYPSGLLNLPQELVCRHPSVRCVGTTYLYSTWWMGV